MTENNKRSREGEGGEKKEGIDWRKVLDENLNSKSLWMKKAALAIDKMQDYF